MPDTLPGARSFVSEKAVIFIVSPLPAGWANSEFVTFQVITLLPDASQRTIALMIG
jgi:hypothetical protein